MLIRNSGSTVDSSFEKIRSGESYLYKMMGMESEVIEVRLKKKISCSCLNRTLNVTNIRYPYFNTKVIEKTEIFI